MKRWGALIIAVSAMFASACGGGGGGGIAPTAAGPFATQADQVVNNLAMGKFDAVAIKFDPTMQAALSVAVLQNNWKSYTQLLGSYTSHAAPASVRKGQLDVERVPVTLANGKGEVRITFHPDGTIAGLYFLKAGAPSP